MGPPSWQSTTHERGVKHDPIFLTHPHHSLCPDCLPGVITPICRPRHDHRRTYHLQDFLAVQSLFVILQDMEVQGVRIHILLFLSSRPAQYGIGLPARLSWFLRHPVQHGAGLLES